VDHQRGSLTAAQVGRGERVGGGDKFRRAVRANLQRSQITTGGMSGVTGHLEMPTCGKEVTVGSAAVRGNRIGVTFAHRMDV